MCVEREPDRDSQSEDEQALEEIRQLFARYRQVARHGVVTERHVTPEAPADDVGPPVPSATSDRSIG